ncbi:amino acid ABC transporter substrate-binding protein [Chromatiales bacterium (ex Bugula neritina AB1)]|nr:amino acid ABC transporter substrate-binding protein [Chromatiales bacterium (ex Bugula neritina AB1)]
MSQSGENSYLQIENLWKAFGNFIALQDVSLNVRQGEFVCFLGPSGCGKTTLLRAIAGLDYQSRGTIVQEGRDVSLLPPSQRDFGIVFQSYALFPNLTIRKNIAFGLENTGRKKSAIDTRVDELLQLVGLPEQGNKYPAQLSGGQQQRIALARAIATSPGLLLLDEPLSALDAKVRVRLRHEIKSLQRELGVTTIMVTHDQEEALAMADRIVVINEGRIEQTGSPTEIYQNPQTLFVADFIGEMNQFTATIDESRQLRIGDSGFHCRPHDFATGAGVIAAIRPDNIVPHPQDYKSQETNHHSVLLKDMEFLGSFWRCHLQNADFKSTSLIADFSTNAVRRLELEPGREMVVQLPEDNMMVFAAGESAA